MNSDHQILFELYKGLSAVTREQDFIGSIKKYFLDTLEEIEGLNVSFEPIYEVPLDENGTKLSQWVIITFGNRDLGNVSEQDIAIDLFTRKDREGFDLTNLCDTVMNYVIDEGSDIGIIRIPYYDVSVEPWVQVGGIIPYLQPSLGMFEGVDDTKFRSINILCKWGGK